MSNLASYVQTAFTGGEISQAAQGRLDDPHYKISLNVCLNAIPMETGAWTRRPGTRHTAPTRGGKPGKLIPFAFAQSSPYDMEFTDGYLRFTTGPALVMTNDAQAVTAISAATPAVITTAAAHGWSSGNAAAFNSLGANNPLLQNRQFTLTVISPTTFSIADSITGAAINGSTLGAFVSGNVTRVLEIATGYTVGSWASLRSVQAEARTILLNGTAPQVLQATSQPSSVQAATFSYGPASFIDGPYLDPVDGSYITSSALSGVVTLTLSFAAYDGGRAYNVGDFVSSAGINYRSIAVLNFGNAPATSPTKWTPVGGGAAVNDGRGFISSDIGRLIRLLSEPAPWSVFSPYVAGNTVSYADGSGGNSYWTATANVPASIQPGTSTLWALNATGSTWTWAQIVAVSGSALIAPATAIGNMTGGGGLTAAFDGNTTKGFAAAANFSASIIVYTAWSAVNWPVNSFCQYNQFAYRSTIAIYVANVWPAWSGSFYHAGDIVSYAGFVYQAIVNNTGLPPSTNPGSWLLTAAISAGAPPSNPSLWTIVGPMSSPTYDLFVGQNYAAPTTIQSATLYPTSDLGISNGPIGSIINLRAKTSAPSNAADGTLLGTTGPFNSFAPITIISSDQATGWTYVWLEIVTLYAQPLPNSEGTNSLTARMGVAQVQFLTPNVSNGSVITAQIRGPAMLYAQTIRTWRLGVYSDTTGWPPCGTYHEGRIWFGGVISGRFDASVSNGLNGTRLDFTPTSPSGTVSGNNAISYTCTGEEISQFLWMAPDQQGILCGTKSGEWLISAPSQGPLAPTNIKAVRVTKIDCANIEPRRGEHTLLVVHKFARKVVEYFADVISGKFSAPNLSDRSKHMTVKGIAEIAYQQELAPTLWCRRNDGALIGATYKRDTLTTSQGPTIIGWHRHQLGSGRPIESICAGPSVGGNLDALSLITNDTATGVRHVELMTDLLDEGFALTDCWFLDDAIVPSSTVVQLTGGPYGSLLCNGLWAHNGKTVSAWIAGLDCGDFTVSNGSITIPFGDSISGGTAQGLFTAALVASFTTLPAVVGFTYNSDGQLVRPVTQADTGAQAGPGFAKLGRFHRIAFQVYGMVNGSLSFGTDFIKMDPIRIRFAHDVPYTVQQQFSGILRQEPNSEIDYDGMATWRVSRGYPAFVMVVGPFGTKADG